MPKVPYFIWFVSALDEEPRYFINGISYDATNFLNKFRVIKPAMERLLKLDYIDQIYGNPFQIL